MKPESKLHEKERNKYHTQNAQNPNMALISTSIAIYTSAATKKKQPLNKERKHTQFQHSTTPNKVVDEIAQFTSKVKKPRETDKFQIASRKMSVSTHFYNFMPIIDGFHI